MGNILVTGATGFVGHHLCEKLLNQGRSVRGTILASELPSALNIGVTPVVVESLSAQTSWHHALIGVDTVIHLAARVHIMDDSAADPLSEFRLVNTEGTRHLAEEAAKSGVRRLVFISTIKVNGEESIVPYSEGSPANPTDPYGVSKWEAEQILRQIELESGLEVVVVRPTLVYGPGVKGNFLNMLKAVRRRVMLPLASINNRRSLIYVGNLVDALTICAGHPEAAGKTYLVSDGEDVSTPELIRRTASALDVPTRLIPFPPILIRLGGGLLGKLGAVERLTGSLTVNSSEIRRELNWIPPFSMEQGLRETAKWYLTTSND